MAGIQTGVSRTSPHLTTSPRHHCPAPSCVKIAGRSLLWRERLRVFALLISLCFLRSHTFRLDSILKVSLSTRDARYHPYPHGRSHPVQEPVLLLKIDTEGYELSVLQGVISLLESRKARVPELLF
jgi:hypothetical protein